MDHKTVALVAGKVGGEGQGTLSGYGAVFGNTDSQGDIILPGAFAETLSGFQADGFIAWGHDWAMPVATITEAYEDTHGLYLAADFHSTPDAQRARTIAQERLSRGKSMGLSIGFSINPGGAEMGQSARLLKSLTLYEVSLVTVPANPQAQATSAKQGGPEAPEGSYEDRAEDVAEAYTTRYGDGACAVATFPDHAVLCVWAQDGADLAMPEMRYVDVPYALLADGTVSLGIPTEVEAVTQYLPVDDAGKGLLGPLTQLRASLKAGRVHSMATLTRYAAMQDSVQAMRDHLDHLIAEATPDDGKAARRLLADYLAVQARQLGVAV